MVGMFGDLQKRLVMQLGLLRVIQSRECVADMFVAERDGAQPLGQAVFRHGGMVRDGQGGAVTVECPGKVVPGFQQVTDAAVDVHDGPRMADGMACMKRGGGLVQRQGPFQFIQRGLTFVARNMQFGQLSVAGGQVKLYIRVLRFVPGQPNLKRMRGLLALQGAVKVAQLFQPLADLEVQAERILDAFTSPVFLSGHEDADAQALAVMIQRGGEVTLRGRQIAQLLLNAGEIPLAGAIQRIRGHGPQQIGASCSIQFGCALTGAVLEIKIGQVERQADPPGDFRG